jgi:bacteriocin biosynthesis cyclodehydratase domain-containing protein
MTKLLRAYPVDVVPVNDGVQLLRGAIRVSFKGNYAEEVIATILAMADTGCSREALLAEFAEPQRLAVTEIVERMLERNFLYAYDPELDSAAPSSADQSAEDLFYWHFDTQPNAVRQRLADYRVIQVGVNLLGMYLAERLQRLGFGSVEVVDDPTLRNARLFRANGEADCDFGAGIAAPVDVETFVASLGGNLERTVLVVTSDFGGRRPLRAWNEFCVGRGITFLPVAMKGLRGYIGPLVRPRSGACYECYRARENANLENAAAARAGEDSEAQRQANLAAFVDPMMASLSATAAMELLKLAGNLMLPHVSHLIRMSFLEPSVKLHPILRVPRCRVCSPTEWRPEINLSRQEFRNKLAREAK